MDYQVFEPSALLKPFVKLFWVLENKEISENPEPERILPDGCPELIFNYGDRFKRIYPDGSSEIQPQSFLHGQIKQYMDVVPTGKVGIVAARFYPNGAAPFINIPAAELNDKAIDTFDMFGEEGKMTEDQIVSATNTESRIEILQSFLVKRFLSNKRTDALIEACVQSIIKAKGSIEMDELAKGIKISERHLERKFTSVVGISPKLFQRIVRFQHILRMIQQKQVTSLAAVSYEAGYYDQAHFIKDFKEFTGVNPRKYFNEDHDLSDFFTAD